MIDRARGGQVENPRLAHAKPEGLSCSISPSRPKSPELLRSSQHFYIQLYCTLLPYFDPHSHVNHRSAAPISAHQDHVAHLTPWYFQVPLRTAA